MYRIVELFTSINGEGLKSGELSLFLRFAGCNLDCRYCDTRWANQEDVCYKTLDIDEIRKIIEDSGIINVTITGGEPLIQPKFKELLTTFSNMKDNRFEIETNGSIDISEFNKISNNITFTVDYNLPYSEMEKYMNTSNLNNCTKKDVLKFVVGSHADLDRFLELENEFSLSERTNVFLSPVFGSIEPKDIVDFMVKKKLNNIRFQIQMHKIIWNPEQRGV